MIAKIVRITPDGAPFSTQNGTFYPFQIGLDDGKSGQANSKSNPPPYRVGEVVGYAVTGQTPRGADKLKITRSPDASFGNYMPPSPSEHMEGDPQQPHTANPMPPARPQRAAESYVPNAPRNAQEQPSGSPVHGATVGMAINKAVDVWIATIGKDQPWNKDSADTVEEIASQLIQIAQTLERGERSAPF